MPAIFKTILLLTVANIFMSFAWYAHLKELSQKPWMIAAFISWVLRWWSIYFKCQPTELALPCCL